MWISDVMKQSEKQGKVKKIFLTDYKPDKKEQEEEKKELILILPPTFTWSELERIDKGLSRNKEFRRAVNGASQCSYELVNEFKRMFLNGHEFKKEKRVSMVDTLLEQIQS